VKTSLVITAPATYPVSLTEAKTQLRILNADTTYDTEVTRLITAATQWIERRYSISIITQTREQVQDNFYERYPIYRGDSQRWYSLFPVMILYPPVQSITTFAYTDQSGTNQTLVAGTDYTAYGTMTTTAGAQDIENCRLILINKWPTFQFIPDAIRITYVTGFGIATQVPEVIKTAVLMVISGLFENRQEEAIVPDRLIKFEMSIDRIMSTYENFQHVNIYA